MKKLLLLTVCILFAEFSFAQKWAEMMQQPNANFYDIQKEFNEYWKDKDTKEKGNGYKVFKRWEHFVEERVYPSGDLSLLNLTAKNYQEFLTQYNNANSSKNGGNNMIASTTWTAMGPFGALNGSAGSQFLKSGRVNFVRFHPASTATMYTGAPAGGLWKSTNNGVSWTTNTDNLAVTGCSDLAIDPSNTNIMYLATGDGDASDTRSIGVLKSTDGGNTWSTTGLSFAVTSNFVIRRLIINPSNPQILLAATNGGIYRTTNGGNTWTQINSSNTYDLEFKPGNPNTVYAAGTSFRVSTDGGVTFTQISSGISTSAQRMAIAVTTHSSGTNYVYVLASNSSGGFLGLYRSTNSGTSFTTMSSSPNILGWNNPASGSSGQGWYDLCVAASPLNQDEVVIGGVNIWRSTNGGSTWSCIGHWIATGAPFVHADIHDLIYTPSGTLFAGTDGNPYRYTGSSWVDLGGNMNISQIYKIGLSGQSANKWITGHQDNGTSVYTSGSYDAEMGGDGMDCFIDRTSDTYMFGSQYSGSLNRSLNGGSTWSGCTSGLSGSANWVTPWKQDPQTATTFYAGLSTLWRSTNLKSATYSWSSLAALPITTGAIIEFAVAPSNNQVIYVLKSGGIFKTTNGGTSWTTVTGSVPVGSAAPTFIAVKSNDPNTVWVTLSGYSSGNKVFKTTDGGANWTNYTSNLPNIPSNCIVYQPATNDRVYVGMDVGVYYRDNSSGTWTLYNTGLPNTPAKDLEISAAANTKLRLATYGRGVYEVDLLPTNVPPVSQFSVASSSLCKNQPYVFNDQSSNIPTSWSWSVNPSTGVTINTSASQNPTITFANTGTYTVSMIATNGSGSGNTATTVVTVNNTPTITVSVASQTVCQFSAVTFTASGGSSYSWSNGGGSSSAATYSPSANAVYTVTGTTSGCSATAIANVTIKTLPTINTSASPSIICVGQAAILSASGGTAYTWNPGSLNGQTVSVSPTLTTIYSAIGTGTNGCSNTSNISVFVNTCTGINQLTNSSGHFNIYPNPTGGKITIHSGYNTNVNVGMELIDALGKTVTKQVYNFSDSSNTYTLDISNYPAGLYFLKLNSAENKTQLIKVIKD